MLICVGTARRLDASIPEASSRGEPRRASYPVSLGMRRKRITLGRDVRERRIGGRLALKRRWPPRVAGAILPLCCVAGIQSEQAEAPRCRNLNGGFNRFI